MNNRWYIGVMILLVVMVDSVNCKRVILPGSNKAIKEYFSIDDNNVIAKGAKVIKLAGGFKFTEGPVEDIDGGVYFTDDPNRRVHKWFPDGRVVTVIKNSGRPAGLAIDRDGSLLVCEKDNHRVISLDRNKNISVLANTYNNKLLNEPNDLWVDLKGGIYFSDPYYGPKGEMPQDGKHVYYLTPDRKTLLRVTHDVVHPNGVIGTSDGKILYVADNRGEVKTWRFTINEDGTLSNKNLLADEGSDGVTLDIEGNIYLCMDKVYVYSKEGVLIDTIELPERPHNLCFYGEKKLKLFITAGTSIYSLDMRVRGMY
ncbi:SMP-30/gluconolactonase/LRE family protein [Candidatus Latescibacterota bacterium]